MTISALFTTSTQGMISHSKALESISNNIANLNTGGFKRTEIRFSTQLTQSTGDEIQDVASVTPIAINTIDQQGRLQTAKGALDTAIIGSGFFVTNTQLDGSGDTLYTRDGNFSVGLGNDITVPGIGDTTITVKEGYLVDRNGNFVQGWLPEPDGTFSNSGTLQALRVDTFAFNSTGEATTTGELTLNLPAAQPTGTKEIHSISLFDSIGKEQSATFNFTKDAVTNQWTLSLTTSNVGDTIASTPLVLSFDGKGQLTGTTTFTAAVTWDGGGSASAVIDISGLTQLGGDFIPFDFTRNGFGASELSHVSIDPQGQVVANFQNSTFRPVYKLPLAVFTNYNGLEAVSGNSFIETLESGPARFAAASEGGVASFAPGVLELSNVELADEFTRMIITQAAYNASAMAFTTMDEITQTTTQLI